MDPKTCFACGFSPKNVRDLVADGWNDWQWRCNNMVKCKARQERAAAKAAANAK